MLLSSIQALRKVQIEIAIRNDELLYVLVAGSEEVNALGLLSLLKLPEGVRRFDDLKRNRKLHWIALHDLDVCCAVNLLVLAKRGILSSLP